MSMSIAFPERVLTPRLQLRRLLAGDEPALSRVWAEPQVWRALRPDAPDDVNPAAAGAAMVARHVSHWEEHGFGLWAVELRDEPGEVAGWIGASHPTFVSELAREVEIGWTLGERHWGRGYASEGARRAVQVAFERLGCERVVSLIHRTNRRSIAVAQRLDMRQSAVVSHSTVDLRLRVYELSASNSRLAPGSSPGDGA
jgi:RimJ/RimL family protein N-acetyltransferase